MNVDLFVLVVLAVAVMLAVTAWRSRRPMAGRTPLERTEGATQTFPEQGFEL